MFKAFFRFSSSKMPVLAAALMATSAYAQPANLNENLGGEAINVEGGAGVLSDQQQATLQAGGSALARKRVMNWPCVSGGTINRCMQNKSLMPGFKDGGWETKMLPQGGYEVQRVLLMNGNLPLRYVWQINKRGVVVPLTVRAELITERSPIRY